MNEKEKYVNNFYIRQKSCTFVANKSLKRIKHIVNIAIWTLVSVYFVVIILTHIPPVQSFLGQQVSHILGERIGTKVSISRVDLGFLNRLIIDDIAIKDQANKDLLRSARMSVKFEILPLAQGKIVITSAQLFGLKANLYKTTATSKPNFQFVLDSLSSKESKGHTPLDLEIGSLIIRHGSISYNQLDAPRIAHHFSLQHIHTEDLSAHVMLETLTDDSIHINAKRIAFKESAGLNIHNLAFRLKASKKHLALEQLKLETNHTTFNLEQIEAKYQFKKGQLDTNSLLFSGSLLPSTITLADFSCFTNSLEKFKEPIRLSTQFKGSANSLRLQSFVANTPSKDLSIKLQASIKGFNRHPAISADMEQVRVGEQTLKLITNALAPRFKLPEFIGRMKRIELKGKLRVNQQNLIAKGFVKSGIGDVSIDIKKIKHHIDGYIATDNFNIGMLTANKRLGHIVASIKANGDIKDLRHPNLIVKGFVNRFDYNNYIYRNISIDGSYLHDLANGIASIDDPNGSLLIKGKGNMTGTPKFDIVAEARHFNPSVLQVTNQWPGAKFDFNLSLNVTGKDFNRAIGNIHLTDFVMTSADSRYQLDDLRITALSDHAGRHLNLNSDFGHLDIDGNYNYNTLAQTVINIIGSKLPTIPGLPKVKNTTDNNFSFSGTITKADWLRYLFNIPVELEHPMTFHGFISDHQRQGTLSLSAPSFVYAERYFRNILLDVNSPNDTLSAFFKARQMASNGTSTLWTLDAKAANNKLRVDLGFDNNGKTALKGNLITSSQFGRNDKGQSEATTDILPSSIHVGDTVWSVFPSTIQYSKDRLVIDHFAINHHKQHIEIDGIATASHTDSLQADLKDVDVSYILNLVNFHSVEFSGQATGKAYISGVFSKPEAEAHLVVNHFKFEDGRLGVLTADARLNNTDRQIDIHGIANDGPGSMTQINGYVSPQKDDIDLNINARNTRAEFLESFCGSFMDNVKATATGNLRVFGPLNQINLTGEVIADGDVRIKSLNTVYTLKNDIIRFEPNDIIFARDTIYDLNHHIGIVNGHLRHQYLKDMTYDIQVEAKNLLAYDFKDFGDDTFCGTVFATGTCRIEGKSGEVNIDVDAYPEKGSVISYNVSSPEAIGSQEFIHWNEHKDTVIVKDSLPHYPQQEQEDEPDIPTDIHLSFLIHANPEATLKLIMDQQSGDYIALNGNGVIRANYYNKGAFEMFGTYLVDHGIYKMTIQNVIRRDFQFQEGGSIVFGGDPFNAALNLKAQYTVNGVSLSDLNIGRSFSNNTIRVNCLMNIGGVAHAPKVDFALDMPTVNSNAQQMIYSLINSEEEMNQQVLYLLAVGRFYSQGNNNATGEGAQSQTSLAMQSILSGQISQQLNNVLNSVVNNTNWNFGANISTGDEGWNNAEYEGILSGRLLNNRLLVNGEFGYRDNPYSTTNFIGDFDIRYLISPNGNFAARVYNQTNDRYFTRNSLNTQGIGIILKKDFNGLRDLFGIKRKQPQIKKKNKTKK